MKPRIRPKVRNLPEPPAGELFPLPAALATDAQATRRTPAPTKTSKATTGTRAKRKTGTAVAIDKQPFLPGLSRRGRPRLQNPVPASERAANSRNKRVAAGAKRIELMLMPEVADSLESLAEQFKESRAEVVSRLIVKAARRLLK